MELLGSTKALFILNAAGGKSFGHDVGKLEDLSSMSRALWEYDEKTAVMHRLRMEHIPFRSSA